MSNEYKQVHTADEELARNWHPSSNQQPQHQQDSFAVQVEPTASVQFEQKCAPSRNLILSVVAADKLGLMFACGAFFALEECGLMSRIQVMATSGLANMLVACLLDAIYDPNSSQPNYTRVGERLQDMYQLVFSFCENNQELYAWWPRMCHPGMWLAPWQTSLAADIRERFEQADFQYVDSHSKVKALMSGQSDESLLPVFLCGATRTDSDKLVIVTNDIRAPAARHMHQQFAHMVVNCKPGDPMDFAAILTAISLPHCLSGCAKTTLTTIDPLLPGEVDIEAAGNNDGKSAMLEAESQFEAKRKPFEQLTASGTSSPVLSPSKLRVAGSPDLPSAKRQRVDMYLRHSLLLDPYSTQSCATYFTKLKLKLPDNNSDKLLLIDGFTNSATFRSMLPIDQRSRMRSELNDLQSAADVHMDKLCAYRKQIVQCHSQTYADTPQMLYTHHLLRTLSGDFKSGPESKANEALLSGRWSGLPRSLCELAFRWGYMQTWLVYGDNRQDANKPQTLSGGLTDAKRNNTLPRITSGDMVINCIKRVEDELRFK